MKKILEDKNYSHLNILLDDVITPWQTPSRLDIHNVLQPGSTPKNIAKSEQLPKQEVIIIYLYNVVNSITKKYVDILLLLHETEVDN